MQQDLDAHLLSIHLYLSDELLTRHRAAMLLHSCLPQGFSDWCFKQMIDISVFDDATMVRHAVFFSTILGVRDDQQNDRE